MLFIHDNSISFAAGLKGYSNRQIQEINTQFCQENNLQMQNKTNMIQRPRCSNQKGIQATHYVVSAYCSCFGTIMIDTSIL